MSYYTLFPQHSTVCALGTRLCPVGIPPLAPTTLVAAMTHVIGPKGWSYVGRHVAHTYSNRNTILLQPGMLPLNQSKLIASGLVRHWAQWGMVSIICTVSSLQCHQVCPSHPSICQVPGLQMLTNCDLASWCTSGICRYATALLSDTMNPIFQRFKVIWKVVAVANEWWYYPNLLDEPTLGYWMFYQCWLFFQVRETRTFFTTAKYLLGIWISWRDVRQIVQ